MRVWNGKAGAGGMGSHIAHVCACPARCSVAFITACVLMQLLVISISGYLAAHPALLHTLCAWCLLATQDLSHLRTLQTPLQCITAAAYLPGSSLLALGSYSPSLLLVDPASGEQAGRLPAAAGSAALSLAGWQEGGGGGLGLGGGRELLAVGDADGGVSLMEVLADDVVSMAMEVSCTVFFNLCKRLALAGMQRAGVEEQRLCQPAESTAMRHDVGPVDEMRAVADHVCLAMSCCCQ